MSEKFDISNVEVKIVVDESIVYFINPITGDKLYLGVICYG